MDKYIRDENTGMIINKDDTEYQNFVRERALKRKLKELEDRLSIFETRLKILEEKNNE